MVVLDDAHREYFESTIVRFLLASGDHAHYKFVFATINPLLVCMHDAEHLAIGDVALEAVHSVVHGVNHWTHCFKVSLGISYFSDEGCFDFDTFDTLPDVSKRESDLYCCNASWIPLDRLRPLLGGKAYPRKPGDDVEREKETAECKELPREFYEDPAMWEHTACGGLGEGPALPPKAFRKASVESSDSESSDGELSDGELEELEDLYTLRADCSAVQDKDAHFDWTVRGSKWTKLHKGVAWDCYIGRAKGRVAREWCMKYKLSKINSFATALYECDEVCVFLARLWLSRMSHFYGLWLSHGASFAYIFSVKDLQSHVIPVEIDVALAACCSAADKRKKRIMSLVPRKRV